MGTSWGDTGVALREQAPSREDRSRERRCEVLLREGEVERAMRELRAMLAEDDANPWAHAHLGDLLCLVRGDHEGAVAHLSRALELNGTYAWAFAHRGAALER